MGFRESPPEQYGQLEKALQLASMESTKIVDAANGHAMAALILRCQGVSYLFRNGIQKSDAHRRP